MLVLMMLLVVGGIALAQAVSSPHQVTLRWFRLGGIIAVALLAIAATILLIDKEDSSVRLFWVDFCLTCIAVCSQLIFAQLGRRFGQRAMAIIAFAACTDTIVYTMQIGLLTHSPDSPPHWPVVFWAFGAAMPSPVMVFVAPLSAGLIGGFLMTMLLGHAYLTAAGQMTQAPFRRLVIMLAWLLGIRGIATFSFGLYPFITASGHTGEMWNVLMIIVRCLVGLGVPAVFTWMIYDCVNRRSNQSATGILYVTVILVIIGEVVALVLLRSSGGVF